MAHYVGSWLGSAPPRGRTACGIVVFKTRMNGEADTVLNNRIEYVDLWSKVSCPRCRRSTEYKHLSSTQRALTAEERGER